MNVYTKKGDKGETALFGGTRIKKDDLRVWSYGTVDEANSILGVIYAALSFDNLKNIVRVIQQNLFLVGASLASDEAGRKKLSAVITQQDITWLEEIIDDYTRDFAKMDHFTIPGETVVSSTFHVARTVIRRAERHVVELSRQEEIDPLVLTYLNRLSDGLYILAKMEVYQTFVKKVSDKVLALSGSDSCTDFNQKINEKPEEILYDEKVVSLLSKAAYEKSSELGIPVCFSIVDKSGDLLYFKRFLDALLISVSIAQNKAYTSALMQMETGHLAKLAQPKESLFGIAQTDCRLVIFGGGFPLFLQGKLIGAIGISGGSVEEDELIGRHVVKAFEMAAKKQIKG